MWSTRRDLERHNSDVVDKEWNTERWDSKGRDIRERTVESTFLASREPGWSKRKAIKT